VNDFASHNKPGSGVNGLFSCSSKLRLVILQICLCFLFASNIKITLRIKGKDLNGKDDLKTYLVICICMGAAALSSCQSPVRCVIPRPSLLLQDKALSFDDYSNIAECKYQIKLASSVLDGVLPRFWFQNRSVK